MLAHSGRWIPARAFPVAVTPGVVLPHPSFEPVSVLPEHRVGEERRLGVLVPCDRVGNDLVRHGQAPRPEDRRWVRTRRPASPACCTSRFARRRCTCRSRRADTAVGPIRPFVGKRLYPGARGCFVQSVPNHSRAGFWYPGRSGRHRSSPHCQRCRSPRRHRARSGSDQSGQPPWPRWLRQGSQRGCRASPRPTSRWPALSAVRR